MKFYSEKLDKLFDTEKALVEAELAAKKAAEEKAKKAEAKKAEAKVVEDAFKAHNAAKKAYNENVIARRKKYAEDLAALKAAFEADVEVEAKKLDAAAKAYDDALSEFTKKHKEGFHMTLKDGDNVVNLHSIGERGMTSSTVDINRFNDIIDEWLKSIFG